jgi:hypothetical protein
MKGRKWCKFVSPPLPVFTKDTICPNQIFYVWLVYLNWLFVLYTGWKLDSLQMMIFVNICSTWNMVEIKTRFDVWITRNDVNGVSLFHLSYLITLMAYLCSQSSPISKSIFYDWVCLNRCWKRDSLQIWIFVYFCSTWSVVELKTRFETWITRNDVNFVSLFNLSYLITLMAYLCSQRTPNAKSSTLCLIGRSTEYLCWTGFGDVSLSK